MLDYPREAEFWPAGDRPLVQALFESTSAVTPDELLRLDSLISECGEDTLIPAVALIRDGYRLHEITAELVDESSYHVFESSNFIDARSEAAFSLFELYWPEAYASWETGQHPDGLHFDSERFLDSPQCSLTELSIGERRIVLVRLQ